MKKLLVLILTLALGLFVIVGCGQTEQPAETGDQTQVEAPADEQASEQNNAEEEDEAAGEEAPASEETQNQ